MLKRSVPGTAEMLLYLDIMIYFPEFSHGGYETAGGFVRDFLRTPAKKRPTTMFSGFCSDERSGVVKLMEIISRFDRLMKLKIVYSPSGAEEFNSLCFAEDVFSKSGELTKRNIYVIIGCSYRLGEYSCGSTATNTWADNFLGAVQADTLEQLGILSFYDKAVAAAVKDLPENAAYSVTVSGHSKAGNMAQYITVLRENVSHCLSFDGQGFSGSFLRKYHRQIMRRGSRIVSICPDMSITGSLLHRIENAATVNIRTGFMREKSAHIMPLYYHIPVSVLDSSGRLRKQTNLRFALTDILKAVSAVPETTARFLPFFNAERALKSVGTAVMLYFKGSAAAALVELCDLHALLLLSVGLITAAVIAPEVYIKSIFERPRAVFVKKSL